MSRLRDSETQLKMNRREFLKPLALAAAAWPGALRAAGAEQSRDTLIRTIDFSSLRTLLTPNDKFFIRNHFAVPQLSLSGWKLRVTGQVRSALELSYAEILSRPNLEYTATLECAGNGVGSGGVSAATWIGVSLGGLLNEASLGSGVKYIRLVGADRGVEGSSSAPLSFMRSIPVEKAMHPDTLLAFQMNGAALPAEHGYPVRAIIPGWYGMDSVKWLVRVEALEREDESFYMTERYMAIRLQTLGSEQVPVTGMRVKSQIAQPRQGEILMPGLHMIRGAAWAGENRVAKVEVSTNGGKDWNLVDLEKDCRPYVWVLWNYPWDVRVPGTYTIVVRASDDQGNVQPSTRDSHRFDSYEQNWYHSVQCEVS
jgi:DMSO/TMAO reductase YedYZ molybdopterin-dependent catalytic subunit